MVNWKIVSLETKPLIDGLPEVVVAAIWNCRLEQQGKHADRTGIVHFSSPNPMNFTLYSSLTEQQVLNWIWGSNVNKSHIEKLLQDQIDQEINPDPKTPPLPWA